MFNMRGISRQTQVGRKEGSDVDSANICQHQLSHDLTGQTSSTEVIIHTHIHIRLKIFNSTNPVPGNMSSSINDESLSRPNTNKYVTLILSF